MAVQEDFVQLALFVFEFSASLPVAVRFPAVFFPMAAAVLVRNSGAWALWKAGGTGIVRKEKARASRGRRRHKRLEEDDGAERFTAGRPQYLWAGTVNPNHYCR